MSLLKNLSRNQIRKNMGVGNRVQTQIIKQLPVNLLVENPNNFYLVGNVDELKNSIIAAGGVKQNLIVEPMNDGRYMIISGHRRCKAVNELLKERAPGIADTVPCEISTDRYENQLLLIMTNSTTRKLTVWERVEQYKQLKSLFEGVKNGDKERITGRKRDAIAEMLDESKTNIARYSAISNNLQAYYEDWMKSEKLGISAAYNLSKLPQNQQKAFYELHTDDDKITLESIKDFLQTEEVPERNASLDKQSNNNDAKIKMPERKKILATATHETKKAESPLKKQIKKIILKYSRKIRPQITLTTDTNYVHEEHSTDVDYIGIDDNNGRHLYARDFVRIRGLLKSNGYDYGMICYDQENARYVIAVFIASNAGYEADLQPCTFGAIKDQYIWLERIGNASFGADVEKMCQELMRQVGEQYDKV